MIFVLKIFVVVIYVLERLRFCVVCICNFLNKILVDVFEFVINVLIVLINGEINGYVLFVIIIKRFVIFEIILL